MRNKRITCYEWAGGETDTAPRQIEDEIRNIYQDYNNPHGAFERHLKEFRQAFEGYEAFSNEQLWDIKQNGYPTDVPVQQLPDVWRQEDTYGGNGWEKGPNGLLDLDAEGYQYRPDFNDEVFQVATMEPPDA